MTWVEPRLFLWAIAAVVVAWVAPRRWQPSALAALGLTFVATMDIRSVLLLAALGGLTYVLSIGRKQTGWRVAVTIVAVSAAIVYFKRDFRIGAPGMVALVPLGLSYFGLRIVHYAFEAYKGGLPKHSVADYVRYLLFFPTFVAGPINRFAPYLRDCRRRRWDAHLFAEGMERVLYGCVKIVVLASYITSLWFADWLQAQTMLPAWLAAYLGCLKYGANLYFQFAGYSDIAIGIGLLMGYRIEENFNWPFIARNISEFWRRWHMTLSEWCRSYVFSPVAATARNPYLGVVASMLVLGMWHELTPRYAAWGVYHGLGIAMHQVFVRLRGETSESPGLWWRPMGGVLAWLLTMNFVIVGFAITSSDTLAEGWRTILTILTIER